MMHAGRYFFRALEPDQQRMGKALHLIARLYGIEDRAKSLTSGENIRLRERLSSPVMAKLHEYGAEDPRGSPSEESGGSGRAVCTEPVGCVVALPGRWGFGDRQWRYRASQPGRCDRPEQTGRFWEATMAARRRRCC